MCTHDDVDNMIGPETCDDIASLLVANTLAEDQCLDGVFLDSLYEDALRDMNALLEPALVNNDDARARPKQFTCLYPSCCRAFSRLEHLKTHVRVVHNKERRFPCTTCTKRFGTKQALDVHVRTHTDARPYACGHPGCGRRFRQKMHALRHARVHTGERPFVCNVCRRSFSQISSMRRHVRTMHAGACISVLGA